MSLHVPVEVPTEVLLEPLAPALADGQIWDTDRAVPDAVALAWIDSQPFAQWSVAMLGGIDPTNLPASELPSYIKACDRAESLFAARKDRATLLMAGPSDAAKNFRECLTPAHELAVALRIPLGAAHADVHRSRRLAFFAWDARLVRPGSDHPSPCREDRRGHRASVPGGVRAG